MIVNGRHWVKIGQLVDRAAGVEARLTGASGSIATTLTAFLQSPDGGFSRPPWSFGAALPVRFEISAVPLGGFAPGTWLVAIAAHFSCRQRMERQLGAWCLLRRDGDLRTEQGSHARRVPFRGAMAILRAKDPGGSERRAMVRTGWAEVSSS